ncbi:hypothetical protein JCM17960_01460 [Magnetospira thiophila]
MEKRRTKGSADPIDKYVGTRVRARRMGLRLSQTKLGEAIGVTFQQVQKYENGTNRIGSSNLFKIARVLDVGVSHFFEGIPDATLVNSGVPVPGMSDQPQATFDHDPMNSREAIELMHNYYRITDEEVRKRLYQFMKSLANSYSHDAD